MNSDPIEQRLAEAEMAMARALQRLSALRRAAIYGSYDAAAFDQAVRQYRVAEGRVIDARREKSLRERVGAVATVAEARPEAVEERPYVLEPTPRLLFIRWLVQTGRLSDWDDGRPSAESPA
jgi:hypothetical protein